MIPSKSVQYWTGMSQQSRASIVNSGQIQIDRSLESRECMSLRHIPSETFQVNKGGSLGMKFDQVLTEKSLKNRKGNHKIPSSQIQSDTFLESKSSNQQL
jgi:hypothetical protein